MHNTALTDIYAKLDSADPAPFEAEILGALNRFESAYRAGRPLISDDEFDVLEARAAAVFPGNPFFAEPGAEPDDAFAGGRIKHRIPMLSTDKCYSDSEVGSWVSRVLKAAAELGVPEDQITVRVTPKLDGIAAVDYGDIVATRGRNGFGTDITRLIEAGVPVRGGRGCGPGELVIDEAYFQANIREQFGKKYPRNYIAGLAGSDELKPHHTKAIAEGAVWIQSYSDLDGREMPIQQLVGCWEAVMDELAAASPVRCDGAVVDVMNEGIRALMGSGSTYHRWQIALKRNDQFANATVRSVIVSTGRTGRLTPKIEIEPVELDGVTVTYATAHNAAWLAERAIGPGAVVRLTRGGDVIPKILSVVTASDTPTSFDQCPVCGGATEPESERYIRCANPETCSAQGARSVEHFFKTIAVCKGFGPSTCATLFDAGIVTVPQVYAMDEGAFVTAGISKGDAVNLVRELERSRQEPISEAVFLGAFGLRHLGRGDSRKLLQVFDLDKLDAVTVEELTAVDGFAEKTAVPIVRQLQARWSEIRAMLDLGFNLESVRVGSIDSPVAGKTIVFTGAMESGARSDMEAQARALGANVGGSVSSKTDLLVCGAKVGATKIQKAEKHGVRVISEAEYLELVG